MPHAVSWSHAPPDHDPTDGPPWPAWFACLGVDPELLAALRPEARGQAAWRVAALQRGGDAAEWAAYGAAVDSAAAWLGSAAAWWSDRKSPDLDRDPLAAWLARRGGPGALALAGGGALTGADLAAARAHVRTSEGRAAVVEAMERALAAPAPNDLQIGPASASIAAGLGAAARTLPVQPPPAAEPAWSPAHLDDDLRHGKAYLLDAVGWPRVAEVHREGVAGIPSTQVARLFPLGLLLEDFGRCDGRVTLWAGALVREAPPVPLRYYAGWRGLPPDIDTLGVGLRLAASARDHHGDADASLLTAVTAWTGPLAPFRSGHAPGTWLSPLDDAAPAWMHPPCTAARLSLLLGLTRWGDPRWAEVGAALCTAVLDANGVDGAVFFERPVAERRLMEAAAALARPTPGSFAARLPATLRSAMALLAERTAADVLARQAPRGALCEPADSQGTAHLLVGLAAAREAGLIVPPNRDQIARAARKVSEARDPDGSWPEAPLYRVPGRRGTARFLRAREVTTATCLAGAAAARSLLAEVG